MPRMFTKDGFDREFFIVYAKEIPRCRFFTFSKKEDSLNNFFCYFMGVLKNNLADQLRNNNLLNETKDTWIDMTILGIINIKVNVFY